MNAWQWALEVALITTALLLFRLAVKEAWFLLAESITEALEAPGFVNEGAVSELQGTQGQASNGNGTNGHAPPSSRSTGSRDAHRGHATLG